MTTASLAIDNPWVGRGRLAAPLRGRGEPVPMPAVWQRLSTAVILLPLLVGIVLGAPAAVFHALVVAASAACVWELGRMFERAGRGTPGALAVIAAAAVTASFAVEAGPVPGPVVALSLAILTTLAAPIFSRTAPSTDRAGTTLFALTYVSWLLGHAVLLRQLPGGGELVLLLLGVTWVGETAAYSVGSAIGRHKLAPVISPGKTVEGAAAQVLVSLVAALVLAAWLAPGWGVGRALVAGLLLGVVGQVGDLAESVIKRSVGTKDTGGLLPGHGGVLDRLDSLLFNAPLFYYFVVLSEVPR